MLNFDQCLFGICLTLHCLMLTLQNRDYLRQCHRKIGLGDNVTTLRANYYPPLKGTFLSSYNHQFLLYITNRVWCSHSFPVKFKLIEDATISIAYYNSNTMVFL